MTDNIILYISGIITSIYLVTKLGSFSYLEYFWLFLYKNASKALNLAKKKKKSSFLRSLDRKHLVKTV